MTTQDQIKAIQKAVLVKQDGILGPKTIQAIYDKIVQEKPAVGDSGAKEVVCSTVDERSAGYIKDLLPELQVMAVKFLTEANRRLGNSGITAKIISGHRGKEEQDALYAQGRTKPGKIVTNAKFPKSNHNHRRAFDIGLFKGKEYLGESPLYRELGPIGESVGLAWGGRFKSILDLPHYELPK